MAEPSTRAKWRALRSARVSTPKKYLNVLLVNWPELLRLCVGQLQVGGNDLFSLRTNVLAHQLDVFVRDGLEIAPEAGSMSIPSVCDSYLAPV
jgi:hypothetical protein